MFSDLGLAVKGSALGIDKDIPFLLSMEGEKIGIEEKGEWVAKFFAIDAIPEEDMAKIYNWLENIPWEDFYLIEINRNNPERNIREGSWEDNPWDFHKIIVASLNWKAIGLLL